ncbi:histidine kinase [Myxococcus sp. K15C18031901]|uniref:sensor histidine kinase n=1 Tax=Myxococcus dinghuensis TaxID=2906761 RepID=UPI0020A7CF6B|nr:histidine kinase [Myxococcus dinghuensis]MCP3098042.1 histidine kinase [Myxococcus dinghuensis]
MTRGPSWRWWLLSFAYWTLQGVAAASEAHSVRGVTWGHALVTEGFANVLWAPIAIAILWMGLRFPLERRHWRAHALLHAGGALAVSFSRATVIYALDPWVHWYEVPPAYGEVLQHALLYNPFIYLILLGVAHAVYLAEQVRLKDTQLARAQLHVLKAQLHPHFLFNTLNSISALVHRDPRGSERMIARLSDLLRGTLDAAHEEVPLREELRTLQLYLDIQGVRFTDRLQVRQEIAPDALGAHVPHLLLQPLVENAIQHGIAPRSAPGTVTVAARREGAELLLEVRDDGVGLRDGAPRTGPGSGKGLWLTRERLVQLYGMDHRMELRGATGGGASVTLCIPYRTGPVA